MIRVSRGIVRSIYKVHRLPESPHKSAWQITLSCWRRKMHSTTWENASRCCLGIELLDMSSWGSHCYETLSLCNWERPMETQKGTQPVLPGTKCKDGMTQLGLSQVPCIWEAGEWSVKMSRPWQNSSIVGQLLNLVTSSWYAWKVNATTNEPHSLCRLDV
jgi:hypothetical protein